MQPIEADSKVRLNILQLSNIWGLVNLSEVSGARNFIYDLNNQREPEGAALDIGLIEERWECRDQCI